MAGSDWKPEHLKAIVQAEADVINRRRDALNAASPELKRPKLGDVQAGAGAPVLDVTALALSGGGIRSASFSLGVLQALNEHGVLKRIDYLSTVSGGGYMGSALSATLTRSQGQFVFGESTGKRANSSITDVMDTPAVGQLRNYSNYLIPFGMRDLLTALAIIFRGLVANVSLVLPVILLSAAVTIFSNPFRSDLIEPNVLWFKLDFLKATNFGITLVLALAAFPIFFIWAAYRSRADVDKQSEFRTRWPSIFATYLVVVAASFFVELQPFLIDGMFALADEARGAGGDSTSLLTAFITKLAAIATPIAAAVTVFRQQLGTLLKSVTTDSGITAKIAAYAAQAAIWIGGAAIPLLIWVGYLYLCYWGIVNDRSVTAKGKPPGAEIHATIQIQGPGIDLRTKVDCTPSAQNPCVTPATPPQPAPPTTGATEVNPDVAHTPRWLINAAGVNYNALTILPFYLLKGLPVLELVTARIYERVIIWFYLVVSIALFALSWLLTPNANSLHRLYRDRLSKAFLFDPDPRKRGTAKGGRATEGVDLGRDFEQIDTMPISDLVPDVKVGPPYAPYHLINAALNVQGSDYANRRGRNADFFLFSPLFVGSEATNYADMRAFERATGLDLPTAMAISGAAFSSNMGSSSIRALTPTLALLNIRTGYWLRNPLSIAPSIGPANKQLKKRLEQHFYLWSEISGRLSEDSENIYITDGGHIENLGVFELLRRRCKVIVVVDAEADPAMRMPSFIALQRYARIDLGVRIDMPWDDIRTSTTCWMGHGGKAATAGDPPKPSLGPHAAIGAIYYDGGQTGWLLYIKSSLSGDENDYVRDYARRYDQFPHESTGDQFFSEEQFEVYRALGFHIAYRLLSNLDDVCALDGGQPVRCKLNASGVEGVKAVREALLGA
jgi:hypothetical protein